jgi:hypothetical protein
MFSFSSQVIAFDLPMNTAPEEELVAETVEHGEESPLSIAHLMVWAACVAVYMSAYHTLAFDRDSLQGVRIALFGLTAIVNGAYLAVLPLMASRWIRGSKFPRSGGEILWVFGAISVLQYLSVLLLNVAFREEYVVYQITRALVGIFVWLPVFLLAAYFCRSHWRAYYLFALVAGFVWYMAEGILPIPLGHRGYLVVRLSQVLLFTFVLLLVAWLDLRRASPRYRWPHWAGIVLGLLYNTVAVLWCVHYLTSAGTPGGG